MRLTRLQVTNYRSLFGERVDIDLSPGMNAIIGPNNCGKSNLLRALALALDPEWSFDRSLDLPPLGPNTRTRVVCHFEVGSSGPEATLLAKVGEAEKALSGRDVAYADRGAIRFAVSCSGTGRKEFFVAKGAGTSQPTSPEQLDAARRAVAQLRSVCRFVYVRSGDSLESLLQGRFRELLHTVLEEHQRTEYEEAQAARQSYVSALRHQLLASLEAGVLSQVQQMFPEVTGLAMEPQVTSIVQSLLDVDVQLEDLVKGGLADKGTGVRGAVLTAMLRYMAANGRRSVVMAVEEPESFLHPAAQETLRDELEAVASSADVTMLVTTHSPFVPSRLPSAKLFALSKGYDGSTRVAGSAAGDSDRTSLVLSLFRSAAQPRLLERAAKEDARALLVVEGWTDVEYLRITATLLGRETVFDGVELIPADGATKAVRRALVFKDELPNTPVVVLLDDDPDGQQAYGKLTKSFGFQGGSEVLYYSAILPSRLSDGVVEAEDLFATSLLDEFIKEKGDGTWTGRTKRTKQWGAGWEAEAHIDFTETAKAALPPWLESRCGAEHIGRWVPLIDKIEKLLS